MKLLMVLIMLSGCATQKKAHVADRIFDLFEDYTKVISDSQIERTATERPKLPEKFKVAVYFKEPDAQSKNPQEWRWNQKDKDLIINSLKTSGIKAGKIFELINTEKKKDDAKSLRLIAAQQGADALLLIQGLSEIDTDANALALSYVAILPAFFVNGNEVSGKFLTQALLWNTKEPFVHAGVQQEGEYSHKRPIAFRQIPRVIKKSKEESLIGLSEKLRKEILEI